MGQLNHIFNRPRVNFGMNNLFVILEIKSFGEKTLIITIKALVSLLTFSSPEVLVTPKQSSKFVTTIFNIHSAYRNISDALGRLRSDEKYVSIYLKPHINILLSCYHVFLSEYNIFDLIPQSTSAQFISMTSYVELRNVLDSVKSSTNISELSPIHRN